MNDPQEFAGYVAFDWADEKHAGAWCIAEGEVETWELDQSPATIEDWAVRLRERVGGRPVAVALEQSKGALIYALLKYDFLVLYPVNPKQAARFREVVSPSGCKDDPHDARFLLELLRKHREHLRPWRPDDATTRQIAQMTEDRRTMVAHKTQLTNALQARLKQYFPLALEVLGSLDTVLACHFLMRFSTFEELQREEPQEIANFYRAFHSCRESLIEQRLETIARAVPLVTDEAIIAAGALLVRSQAEQLLAVLESIKEYDVRLQELMQQHPDAELFQALPGAGNALAPRLLAAFGSDRQRFGSADEVQRFSGIAPVTVASGKKRSVRRRWACNKFLRQTFHEFADQSRRRSTWAKAYYRMRRASGMGHNAAVRALAFKWIRILYRCWKTNTPYNEAHYFDQLTQRGSPILKFMATGTI